MFCSRKNNNKINYIHERALRIVYEDFTNTFDFLLRKDKSVSIHHRNIQKVATEMFKVKNGLSPKIMSDIFTLREKHLNTRSKSDFLRPRIKSVKYGEQSLNNFGPIVWDTMVPDDLKNSLTLDIFSKKIKNWIPSNCPCRLCKNYVTNLGFVENIST